MSDFFASVLDIRTGVAPMELQPPTATSPSTSSGTKKKASLEEEAKAFDVYHYSSFL